MCGPVLPILSLAVAAIGTGASIAQGASAAKRQKAAASQAVTQAADTKAANERAINQANQKSPDLSAIFGMNKTAQGGGVGSTMLTGPGGVSTGTLSLGRNTLLGQ
jgi:hypothetical protein